MKQDGFPHDAACKAIFGKREKAGSMCLAAGFFHRKRRQTVNYDVVMHLDSRDPDIFRLVCRNAANYLNALPDEDFQLHIVANGGGAPCFSGGNAEFRRMAQELVDRGVTIKLCANALAEHNIARDEVWPGCQIVPAGVVEIVRLQREGFAYIKP